MAGADGDADAVEESGRFGPVEVMGLTVLLSVPTAKTYPGPSGQLNRRRSNDNGLYAVHPYGCQAADVIDAKPPSAFSIGTMAAMDLGVLAHHPIA